MNRGLILIGLIFKLCQLCNYVIGFHFSVSYPSAKKTIFYSYRFESCWPAVMKDASGVVVIFNPDVPSHLKEIETWYSLFVSSQGFQDKQCLLIAHHKPGSGVEDGRLPLGISIAVLPKLLYDL